jgi:MFS superfamily sulfate permease-like transporter
LYQKYKSTLPAVPYIVTIGLGVVLAMYLPAPMLHVPPFTLRLGLPFPHFHNFTMLLFFQIIGYALMLAIVDVIEQVMSNAAIEKMDPYKRKTNSRNSVLSMWLGNLASSLFGGMTNLDILQTSSVNIIAGAVTKLSNLFTALTIAFFLVNYKLLEYMPEFLLGGLMIFVGWKMVFGLFHVAEKGRYPLMLAMICAILVYSYGMFEGLLIVVVVHAFILFVIEKYNHTSTKEIINQFLKLFSDPVHPHQTETMNVSVSKHSGGLTYQSIRRSPADKKSLEDFIKDWGLSLTEHSVHRVIGHYDAQAMLWGTFANKLSTGHDEIRHYFEHLLTLPHLKVTFDSCDFRQYGDIYIQSGSYTFSYEKKGKIQTIPARYSFVCKKERTGWYILEHHSSEFPN